MKKIIALTLAMVLCFSLFMTASATDYKYTYGDIEIIFDEECDFSEEMKQKIIDYVINGNDGASTYNLLCSLLGHKETEETIATISHKVRDTHPRCLRQTWELHACTRCEEALDLILLSESYITCCPEE